MEYNVQITYFADNKQQVRIYKNSIHLDDDLTAACAEKRQITKDLKSENDDIADKAWSLYVSKNRTLNTIYQLTRSYKWDYFITLTFNPARVNRSDYSDCLRCASEYFKYLRKTECPKLTWCIVPELHDDGINWHIHGVIGNAQNIKLSDSGKRWHDQVVYNLTNYIYGYTSATKVINNFAVSHYMTKYITKNLSLNIKNRKRFSVSKGLIRPERTVYNLSEKEKLKFIESIGKNILYTKQIEYENQDITIIETENFNPIEFMDKMQMYPF